MTERTRIYERNCRSTHFQNKRFFFRVSYKAYWQFQLDQRSNCLSLQKQTQTNAGLNPDGNQSPTSHTAALRKLIRTTKAYLGSALIIVYCPRDLNDVLKLAMLHVFKPSATSSTLLQKIVEEIQIDPTKNLMFNTCILTMQFLLYRQNLNIKFTLHHISTLCF